MGGVPTKHLSKSKVLRRRQHLKLQKRILQACVNCNFLKPVNSACVNCGFYRGRQVVDVLKKLSKRERKQKMKELETAKEKSEKA